MQFLTNTLINQYTDQIIEAPALAKLPDFNKEGFKTLLKKYFTEIYQNRPKYIENYFNYNPDDTFINTVLKQYGIEKRYYQNLNPSFKKILVYFIEKAYQNKGSLGTLNIFAEIFETIFSAINFYKIIVIKKEVVVDNVRQYFLSYSLQPLYINNKDALLTKFEDKVSLTGKHLMSLDQYSDYDVFPVNTNLIYIQFTSAQSNIDNNKTFNFIIRAYALTQLNLKTYKINNFNGMYFNLIGSDIETIVRYAEILRLRKNNPDFDFHYNPYKATISLVMAKEHISTLEDFLHEYQNIKYNDRKQLTDFRRRWNYFLRNYLTSQKDYLDFNSMENYLKEKYPDLVKYLQNIPEDGFIQFYIDFYNLSLGLVGFEDDYLIMYLNFIFLGVMTGEAFLENFFMPLYKLFQKYIFPIEMDFLNKITETFIIKDKFEGFSTTETFHTWMDLNGWMSKHWLRTDFVKVFYTKKHYDSNYTFDKHFIQVKSFRTEKINYKNNIHIKLFNRYFYQLKLSQKLFILINISKKDSVSAKDTKKIIINSNNSDIHIKNNDISIIVNKTEQTKQKSQDSKFTEVKTSNKDDYSIKMDDSETINLNRYDYTTVIGDLDIYLTFYKEQYRILSSYEQNSFYKMTNQTDEIYFNFYKIF